MASLLNFLGGRKDEQVKLTVGEPVDGVRAVSALLKTKHGDAAPEGFITPEGLLYLYKVGLWPRVPVS